VESQTLQPAGLLPVQPLSYLEGAGERWPLDVKAVVFLALIAGAAGVLTVACEGWMYFRPVAFSSVGTGLRQVNRTILVLGFCTEGIQLTGSALMLGGAIAFFARSRAARRLLLVGAFAMLASALIALIWYWAYQMVVARQPGRTPGDWIVTVVWQLERSVSQCAIPIILIFLLCRPSVRSKFSAGGV